MAFYHIKNNSLVNTKSIVSQGKIAGLDIKSNNSGFQKFKLASQIFSFLLKYNTRSYLKPTLKKKGAEIEILGAVERNAC